jgi:hypothetical protein
VAGKPIKIEFIAEVAQYLRDTKKLEISTEDIADALVATSNDAADLERKLGRAIRASERDVESLRRAVGDLPRTTARATSDASDDFKKFGKEASESGRDTGRDFASSLGEGLASGDVSDSLTDALAGTLGNISGPVSAAVAAGAAIALALYNSFADTSKTQKEKMAEVFGFTDLLTGEVDKLARLTAGIAELGGGDEATGWRDAAKYAAELGISAGEVAELVSGRISPDTEATYLYVKEMERHYDAIAAQGTGLTQSQRETREAVRETLGTTELLRDAARDQAQATATARTHYLEMGHALDPLVVKAQQVSDIINGMPTTWRIGLAFYATDPVGQSLISRSSSSYSPGHAAIAAEQIRSSPYSTTGR